MFERILVPLDGTPLADRTVERALELAHVHGAKVVFLHVQPDFGATGDGAILRSLAPDLYAHGVRGRSSWLLARAEAAAATAKVDCESVSVISDHPHEAIVAASRGCDLVFMASHGRRGLVGNRLGTVTRKVLDLAGVPVLVAAIEVNLVLDAQSQALDVIRAEHRSLGAVVNAMQQHWKRVEAGAAPRTELLRAMLHYVEHYPERLHHPKEEEHLFARLRARTRDCDALLDSLERQHRGGTRRFEELSSLVGEVEAGKRGARARFGAALEEFAKDQWQHRVLEEQLVLPAASRWLTPHDWKDIAAAFGANGDPRFGADADEPFEQLAERVLRLAGEPVGA